MLKESANFGQKKNNFFKAKPVQIEMHIVAN